jgi:hypothetical protein
MSKLYSVKHIGTGKLADEMHLHLQSESGIRTVPLPPKGTRDDIKEEELTDQVRSLAKPWGDRPAVIELIEKEAPLDPELEADLKKATAAAYSVLAPAASIESKPADADRLSRRKKSEENK